MAKKKKQLLLNQQLLQLLNKLLLQLSQWPLNQQLLSQQLLSQQLLSQQPLQLKKKRSKFNSLVKAIENKKPQMKIRGFFIELDKNQAANCRVSRFVHAKPSAWQAMSNVIPRGVNTSAHIC